MSYRESKAKCDYCNGEIDSDEGFRGSHNGEIACRECYEKLEDRVAELEKENEALESENAELREKLEAKP